MSRPSMAWPDGCFASGSAALLTISALVLGSVAGLAQQGSSGAPALQAESALRAGDFERAADLLEQRAQAGDAEAQYHLASLFRSGRGVAHDDALAFRWMKAAAEKGHAKAQFNLGKMYLAGRGIAANTREARVWLAKAAAQGLAEAAALSSRLAERPGAAPQAGDKD